MPSKPPSPGIAVDASELPLLQQAAQQRKIPKELATALFDANEAAEMLSGKPGYLYEVIGQGMRGALQNMAEQHITENAENIEAHAQWNEDMAVWDRAERPAQTERLNTALTELRRLRPGEQTESFITDFLTHYGIESREDYTAETPGTVHYLPTDGVDRTPGAFLPSELAQTARGTGAAR